MPGERGLTRRRLSDDGVRAKNVLLDAMLALSQETLPIPDTGNLRDDMVGFARLMTAYVATPLGEALVRRGLS